MLGSCSLSAGFEYPRPAKEKNACEGQVPSAEALPLGLWRQTITHRQKHKQDRALL